MVALNLVGPVTFALIKSAFTRPTKNKVIVVEDGKVKVVVPDNGAQAADARPEAEVTHG